ncbi:ATP-dependent helicase, partial [Citrobacter sp. AAK_AS5]
PWCAQWEDELKCLLRAYVEAKQAQQVLDYDDLLVFWRQLLAESAQAREELSSRFRHILVDEYQDTNQLQAEIVRLLASHHGN